MGSIEDKHLVFWHQLVKNDIGSKRFHIPSLIFYIVGLLVLIFNVLTHLSNGAYVGAGLTIAIHVVSAVIISLFYKHNETVVDEDNLTFQRNAKWKFFRLLSQAFTVTVLFRICANWVDQAERHETVRMQKILRKDINDDEIHAAVVNKKRNIVKAYFDCIDAFSKSIPQCILQVFIALDLDLPLRFCTWTDCTRLITIFWSMIVASRATASYATSLEEYLKALEFQDYVTHGIPIKLEPPKRHLWWTTFVTNLVVVGTRIFVMAHLLTYGGGWILALMAFLFPLYVMMLRVSYRVRPSYENPPLGIVTLCSEIVDRVINIFVFHMIKPGLLMNFLHQGLFALTYSSIKTGMLLFKIPQFQAYIDNLNYTVENPRRICNFTLFSNSRSKLSRVIHHALNSWDDDDAGNGSIITTLVTPSVTTFQFKDIFADESVCVIFLWVSFVISTVYTLYVQYLVRYDHKLPFQTAVKAWESFLSVKWNESEESLEFALKLLLFGTLDTNVVSNLNYRLPNGIPLVKEAIQVYVEANSEALNIGADPDPVRIHLNPCSHLLNELKTFLKNYKAGEEAELLCNYFENSFDLCMSQMTSFRIAQTENAIYSRHCQAICLGDFNTRLVLCQK